MLAIGVFAQDSLRVTTSQLLISVGEREYERLGLHQTSFDEQRPWWSSKAPTNHNCLFQPPPMILLALQKASWWTQSMDSNR